MKPLNPQQKLLQSPNKIEARDFEGWVQERGLYFVGFPWLNSRKSGILYGIAEDAQYIADAIREQMA